MTFTHIYSKGISALGFAEEQNIFTSNLHSYMCSWVNPFSFRDVVKCSRSPQLICHHEQFKPKVRRLSDYNLLGQNVQGNQVTRLCLATTSFHLGSDIYEQIDGVTKYLQLPNYILPMILTVWIHNSTALYMHCECTQSLQREKIFDQFLNTLYLKQGSPIFHHHWFRLLHPPCSGAQW